MNQTMFCEEESRAKAYSKACPHFFHFAHVFAGGSNPTTFFISKSNAGTCIICLVLIKITKLNFFPLTYFSF